MKNPVSLEELCSRRIAVIDGAMATMLQRESLEAGMAPGGGYEGPFIENTATWKLPGTIRGREGGAPAAASGPGSNFAADT